MEKKYKSMSPEQRMAAADADCDEILNRSFRKDAVPIALRDESYELLAKVGLGEVKHVSWQETGFCPDNRSRSGIIKAKVSERQTNFYNSGVSKLELSKAVSVGRVPGEQGDKDENDNIRAAEASGDILAPVAPKSLTQFSLTCNHSTQAIKGVIGGCAHPDTKTFPNGKLNQHDFIRKQPRVEPLLPGIEWFQIHHIVYQKKPQLIKLIIETDNITNLISTEDISSTLFLKCHAASQDVFKDKSHKDLSVDDKWSVTQSRVLRSELGKEADVRIYCEFTRHWCGEQENPYILKEYDEFCRSQMAEHLRDIQSAMVEKLTKADFGTGQGALWRGATLKMAADNREKPVGTSDVGIMSNKKTIPLILKANQHMAEARNVLADAMKAPCVDTHELKVARDRLDQRLWKLVMSRSSDYQTMSEICYEFMTEVGELLGVEAYYPEVWKSSAKAKGKAKAKGAKRAFSEVSKDGPSLMQLHQLLADKGCVVGALCIYSNNDLPYEVTAINKEGVKLRGTHMKESLYGDKHEILVAHMDLGKQCKAFFKKQDRDCFCVCFFFMWPYGGGG